MEDNTPTQQTSAPNPLNQREKDKALPRHALLIILIGLVIAALLGAAYWDSDCSKLNGATFRSEKEVDDFFGGTMHPQVSFGKDTFAWAVSDMAISGTYECRSGEIIVQAHDPLQLTARFEAGNLIWGEEVYVRVLFP